ncbi:hypothetical protein ACFLQI_03325 [Candidatus Undinarchaeota archaeon]
MTEKKKGKKEAVEKYLEGEISLRQAAKEDEKDLHDMIEILEARGAFSHTTEEGFRFEERQFEYILDKIVAAITKRVGDENLKKIADDLKSDKIDFKEAAKKIKLDMTDLALVLERKKLMTQEEVKHEIHQVLHKKKLVSKA